MSLENDDGSSAVKAAEEINESQKKPRISYTRDFLLSLGELDICQKLPSGFDRSILSEFEDASHGIQDRLRTHGSLPLQGFRRNEYSSSPPARGDSSNFNRGVHGRWDSRSSGWSDKDSDSQSDLDSDSGRRTYGHQSRRSWQNSEHDGLLGSGSFPRPSGFAAGASAPKGQTNEHYQLSRTNEPYHPPRPYKAVPHSRISTNDACNDETFGSSECTSQDRAEEERKRRASFELMRKEQQKVLQEKQKLNSNKHKNDCFTDLILEETKEKVLTDGNSELDSAILSASNNDSRKPSLSSQSSASRPLVPPGFRTAVLEKNSVVTKQLTSSSEKEMPKPEIEEIQLLGKGKFAQNGTLDRQGKIQSVNKVDVTEKLPELKMDNDTYAMSALSELQESLDGEIFELTSKNVLGKKIVSNPSQENTTSILEKLFGSGPTIKDSSSSGFFEQESRPDDALSLQNAQSSKFARWFPEDDKKPVDDHSFSRPNDLLSLIVGGEKVGSQAPGKMAPEQIPSGFSYGGPELTKFITSTIPSDSEPLYNSGKQEAVSPVPAVLTCEDLEQTILSEYIEKSSTLQPPVPEWSIPDQENMDAKAVDNQASHHLLSLLHKGTGTEDKTQSYINVGSSEEPAVSETGSFDSMFGKPKDAKVEERRNPAQSLTLETLFGSAFMKELQSAEAPVSLQRGAAGSARTDVLEPRGSSLPVIEDDPFPPIVDGIGPNRMNYESNLLLSKQKKPTKSDKGESWLQFDVPRVGVDSIEFQTELATKLPKQALDGVEIQLPEEESLFTVGDPVNPHNPMLVATGSTTKADPLHSDSVFDIADKLAALNSGFRGEHPMATHEAPRFVRGPYDMMDPERQLNNLHAQASSPQIHVAQMNHNRRQMFHALDPHPGHINSPMRFPENLMQHDTPPNHQFPANMIRPPFHHPDTRVTGFDIPGHPQLMPQMQMPGNFPPPHLLREFPRPSMVPPHPSNQAANFMQDAEQMHGFPFGHRRPNMGGLGMPLPVPAPEASSGSNHPEAFQRLMEMELRANAKQIRPLNAGHSQGMYGHELDMGFRYR